MRPLNLIIFFCLGIIELFLSNTFKWLVFFVHQKDARCRLENVALESYQQYCHIFALFDTLSSKISSWRIREPNTIELNW